MCPMHYTRWNRHGDPHSVATVRTPEEKLRRYADVRGPEECWIWQGCINNKGYGKTSLDGRRMYAHRMSYEIINGRIPDGLVIDHLCRTPACVNPNHLRVTTHRENIVAGRMRPWGESKYRGVSRNRRLTRRPWCAYLTVNGTRLYLGAFATETEAATARDVVARRYGFSQLNLLPERAAMEARWRIEDAQLEEGNR